jgi:hypothetical protein
MRWIVLPVLLWLVMTALDAKRTRRRRRRRCEGCREQKVRKVGVWRGTRYRRLSASEQKRRSRKPVPEHTCRMSKRHLRARQQFLHRQYGHE